jgi:hypothetical protein
MSAGLLPLSSDELATKADLVAVVDRTIASFIECGTALAEIRDRRLYRDEHPTFEAFVLDRWTISARRARQLMASAAVVASLPSGTAVPLTERHARELMPLRDRPELMAEAVGIAQARTGGKITGDAIAAAVAYIEHRLRLIYGNGDQAVGIFSAGLTSWAPDVDAAEWHHIIAVHMAARVLHATEVLLPRPPWWDTESVHGDSLWAVLVRREVGGFIGWWAAAGLGGDTERIFTGEHIEWNDDLLAEWCAIAEWSADDRRLAAVGHVACWLDHDRPPSLLSDEWLPSTRGAR